MVSGFAAPDGTEACVDRFPGMTFDPLGNTGISISGAGFGCHRVDAGVAAHEKALQKALTGGIHLIDTSANYADGGSEILLCYRRFGGAGKPHPTGRSASFRGSITQRPG